MVEKVFLEMLSFLLTRKNVEKKSQEMRKYWKKKVKKRKISQKYSKKWDEFVEKKSTKIPGKRRQMLITVLSNQI